MFVFPAFDSNYKTRKRTFRCCKKCRNKRIRCIILNSDYEYHGCDNCRKQGFICDLIVQSKVKHEDDPVAAASASAASSSSAVPQLPSQPVLHTPPVAAVAPLPPPPESLRGSLAPVRPTQQFHSPPQSFVLRQSVSSDQGDRKPRAFSLAARSSSVGASLPTPSLTNSTSQGNGSDQHTSPVGAASISNPALVSDSAAGSLPQHHTVSSNGDENTDLPMSKGDSQSGTESWPFSTPQYPPNPPLMHPGAPAPIDNVESVIEKIDWRYLKRHYDFNTTIRQARFYFAKTLTRKQYLNSKVDTISEEVLTRKHSAKCKKLGIHNVLHYRFLLSLHAFTLNTPGFYEISETDLLKLYEIYFYKVNSVLPIVFEAEFWELYKRNKIPTIISYAIVLVISRDELAEPILARSFVNNGASFRANQIRFLTELEMKIRQLLIFLPELGDTEKLARLVTQLLLSLNFKFNKFGNEQSSHDLAQCISYAYSLLIHQEFFHVRIAKEGAQKKSVYLKHVWWVIFTLDRFNALMNGKAMFIKRLDFNVARPTDLPSLDKLVGLAYTLEDTLIAVSRPPRVIDGKETIAAQETTSGDPQFRPGAFIKEEMEFNRDHEKLRALFTEYRKYETPLDSHLPGIPVEKYRDRAVFFLSRILCNQIVLVLRIGQVKYSDDAPDMDEFSLVLSESFLLLLELWKDGRDAKLVMEIPLVPLIMLVAFSVPLTARMRIISKLKNVSNTSIDFKRVQKVMDLSKIFLRELKKFGEKWWFVNEVVSAIDSVNNKMTKVSDGSPEPKRRRRSSANEPVVKRERVSVDSLVTDPSDVESVLPPLLSITSPGFYDEVITKDVSDDEDGDSGDEMDGDAAAAEEVSIKTLLPPMMKNFIIPTFTTAEDLASRAQEIRNLSSTGDIMHEPVAPEHLISSCESITSAEDFNFDIGKLAEVVTDETSFVPGALDFWSELSI